MFKNVREGIRRARIDAMPEGLAREVLEAEVEAYAEVAAARRRRCAAHRGCPGEVEPMQTLCLTHRVIAAREVQA